MTLKTIMEQLYLSKDLDECIGRVVKEHHREDFKQELFIILYTKPEETIIQLYDKGQLKWYVVRIVLNLVNQERNVYNKMYNNRIISYDSDKVATANVLEVDDFEERQVRENKEVQLINEFENGLEEKFGTFYYKSLVDLIVKHGSMREVSRQTGIPIASISEAVKKVRNHLRSKVYCGETINGIY